MEKNLAPTIASNELVTFGIGKWATLVMAFSFQKSTQMRNDPSGFLTTTKVLFQGELDGCMTPVASNSFSCSST